MPSASKCSTRYRKPVQNITDRAKRYRANACKKKASRCETCGATKNLVIGHRDGNESNGAPYNLGTFCKSCNGKDAVADKKAGRGVRTRQYNPPDDWRAEDAERKARGETHDRYGNRYITPSEAKDFFGEQSLARERKLVENPGAVNLAQYVQAVMDHVRGSHDAGGKVLHETPKTVRRQFAKEIWWRRGYRGNPPQDIMPEFWAGKLKDSHGRKVTDVEQARAILLSELRALGKIPARKNPSERSGTLSETASAADNLYKRFHGVKPDNRLSFTVPLIDPYSSHPDLAQFGLLVRLVIGEGVEVATSPNPGEETVTAVEDNYWSCELEFTKDVPEYRRMERATKTQADVDRLKSWLRKNGTPDVAGEPNSRQIYLVGGNQNIDDKLTVIGADPEKEIIDCGFCYVIEYYTQKRFDRMQPTDYFHKFGEKTGVPPRLIYWREPKLLQLVGGEYFVTPRGIEN
jgi:hypothetical protein